MLRLTAEEDERLHRQAALVKISSLEYMQRSFMVGSLPTFDASADALLPI